MTVRMLALLGSAFLVLGGCAVPEESAPASSAAGGQQTEGVYRFNVGAMEAWSLKDGGMSVPNDGKIFNIDGTTAQTAAVLRAAGVADDKLELSINVLLLRVEDRMILLDSGLGAKAGGKLGASLAAAGIAPARITDIVISHSHRDHIGGLLDAGGGLAFPNARVHIASAEIASMRADPAHAALLTAIAGKLTPVEPGAVIAPGLRTLAIRGHTPGHIGVEIASGRGRALAIGDSAHHYVVSMREPEFTIRFDGDAPMAEGSRRALLGRAVTDRMTLFAPHFPFPGVGTVRREGDGFAWVPAR